MRYLTANLAVRWLGVDFPYGTLIVNVVGSFLIGLIQQVGVTSLLIPETTRLFLTVGIMGGLTTYSSFSYETLRLAQIGAWGQAWINVLVTTAVCLVHGEAPAQAALTKSLLRSLTRILS